MPISYRILRATLGFAAAATMGVVIQAVVSPVALTHADSPGSPVWIGNAVAPYRSCADWKNDTGYFPGTTTQYNYYWSGQPQWWNNSSAHICWHNDEIGNSWWRAIDIGDDPGNGSSGLPVYYVATIFASISMTPGQVFSTSSCGGVDVSVWTPNWSFAGDVHYWHLNRNSAIIGTSSITSGYYPGESDHVQYIGTIIDHNVDSCTNTGDHVHQAILQGGWAQPTVNDNVATVTRFPMYFGW
jgi:hypothetical protein